MAILTTGNTFVDGEQVTTTKLNNAINNASFVSGSSGTTDDSSLEVNGVGRLGVKALGIQTGHLAASAVTAAKVADLAITGAKLSAGGPTWDTDGNVTSTGDVIASSAADDGLIVEARNLSTTGAGTIPSIRATNYAGTSSGYPACILSKSRGSSASPSAVQNNDFVGLHAVRAHNGSDWVNTYQVVTQASEAHSGSASGVRVLFQTTSDTTNTAVTRLAIGSNGNIGIGTSTPVATAALQIDSTSKGFLPPRMTTAQRDAISSPAEGLIIYNSTTKKLNFYNGSAWAAVTSV